MRIKHCSICGCTLWCINCKYSWCYKFPILWILCNTKCNVCVSFAFNGYYTIFIYISNICITTFPKHIVYLCGNWNHSIIEFETISNFCIYCVFFIIWKRDCSNIISSNEYHTCCFLCFCLCWKFKWTICVYLENTCCICLNRIFISI